MCVYRYLDERQAMRKHIRKYHPRVMSEFAKSLVGEHMLHAVWSTVSARGLNTAWFDAGVVRLLRKKEEEMDSELSEGWARLSR